MKVPIRHLLTCLAFCNYPALVVGSKLSPTEVMGKIEDVEVLFSKEGPTPVVLEHFDHIIKDVRLYLSSQVVDLGHNELNKSLTQLLFKRALIEISLKKEALAIADLQDVLKLDPLMKPAENKLVDILVSRGDFANLEQYLKDANISSDSPAWEAIKVFQHHWTLSEKLFKEKKFDECLKELNEVAVVSNNNYDVFELYLRASLELFKKDSLKKIKYLGEPEVRINKVIVSLLSKLIKINPVKNLQHYTLLSEFYLITEVQFDQAFKTVKNCLRIDNDFKACGELSKFYSKYAKFLQDLESYSINNGHVYPQLEVEHQSNFDKELNDLNFKEINDFLFHDAVKLTRAEQKRSLKVKTNFDYLTAKVKELGLSNSELLFNIDLTKLACESFIQIGDYKGGRAVCKLVKDKEFFPLAVPEIDQLLKKKDYQGAEKKLLHFNGYVRNTQLYKEKVRPIEEYQAKINQERQRQQQQQQQQQNYYRQQQQQQQQQQQRQQYQQFRQPQSKPKTDYYKILDIGRDADDKTIRKAYRTQTLKYHPDKYKGTDLTPEQIEHKMQDVNKAYEVLSDPELRERYDRGDDPNDPLNGGGQPQYRGSNGGQQFSFNFGNGGGGGGDFFQQFFGGMGGFGSSGGGAGNPFGTHHKVKIKKNKKTKKRGN